jgi:hypothetical protein
MQDLNTLEWQSMIIDKAQFIVQEKQLSDLKNEIMNEEREIEQFKLLLGITSSSPASANKMEDVLEAHRRMEAAEASAILTTSTQEPATSLKIMQSYQLLTELDTRCGPLCSQNVAYSQPFLPSSTMCASRVVPECLLHRSNITFIQKKYTEDKIRDQGAARFWTLCRESEVDAWASSTNMQISSVGSARSIGSGSTIINNESQDNPPACQEEISSELSNKSGKKFTIPSIKSLKNGTARAKAEAEAKAKALDTKKNFQLHTRTTATNRMEGQLQLSLPSPPLTLSPPSGNGVTSAESLERTVSGTGPSFNNTNLNDGFGANIHGIGSAYINAFNDEIDHVNPHLNFGLGHDPNRRPTIGLDTAPGINPSLSHAVSRRTNSSSNGSGSGVNSGFFVPGRAPTSASSAYSAGSRAPKIPPLEGTRKSTRVRKPTKRNNS